MSYKMRLMVSIERSDCMVQLRRPLLSFRVTASRASILSDSEISALSNSANPN